MKDTIVFGGGCFWCTEAIFEMVRGVYRTTPGYAGGSKANPTYGEVCTGRTGHAEVLEIEYDPNTVSLEILLKIFFAMHDPTAKDRQGNDIGNQYRSIILYNTSEQKKAIEQHIKKAGTDFNKPILTEIKKLTKFYPAETYHSKYYDHNPLQPYCLVVTRPKVNKIRKKFARYLVEK